MLCHILPKGFSCGVIRNNKSNVLVIVYWIVLLQSEVETLGNLKKKYFNEFKDIKCFCSTLYVSVSYSNILSKL